MRVLQNPIVQRAINYVADSRARQALTATIGRMFLAGDQRYVFFAEGNSVPAAGTAGYAPSCIFLLTNCSLGQCPMWINMGSATSCAFYPSGPVMGYGIVAAGGPLACTNGSTAVTPDLQGVAMDTDMAFACYEVSDDSDQIDQVVAEEGAIDITLSDDPLTAHSIAFALLRNKCVPLFDIFAAGIHTCVGGAAAEDITISDVVATDLAFAWYNETDDTDVISDVVAGADKITVTCSDDPGTTHKLNYVVLRPRGTFKPSHYIAYAGSHTSVADASSLYQNTVTISGAEVGDIPIVNFKTNAAGIDLLAAKVTAANTLTLNFSADPSTTKVLSYALLRPYS